MSRQPGGKKCSARQHLCLPLPLFSAPPSRHWLRPSTIIATLRLLLVAAVQRQVAQLAVALARDLALAHHQIGGDDASCCPSASLTMKQFGAWFGSPKVRGSDEDERSSLTQLRI